jgi:CBS domain-containing protein
MSVTPIPERSSETMAEGSIARVGDVMTWPVVVIDSGATLAIALERFVASRLRHLVVIRYEPDGGPRCIGVLADRHLAACWPLEPTMLEGRTVADVLPHPQSYVRPEDSLETAAASMLTGGQEAVPAIDEDGNVVGIVTVTDVLAAVAARRDVATRSPRERPAEKSQG